MNCRGPAAPDLVVGLQCTWNYINLELLRSVIGHAIMPETTKGLREQKSFLLESGC